MASSTSIKTQQLEHWLVSDLIEYARNPRKNDHAVDKIAAAIREFGFRVPILAKSDKTVVDGHLRLKAAKKLGIETVPVMLCDDMTDAQIKAFRISVNKVAEFAEWDNELLRLEFEELKEMDFDLDLTGFSTDELDALEFDDDLGVEVQQQKEESQQDYEDDEFTDEEAEDDSGVSDLYTHKVASPVYEIKGECPEIETIYNKEKYKELVSAIEKSGASEDIKLFLNYAATRHIKFNYEKIAEFYAHQNKEVQELMESSALVIIDFDKAIENGLVQLSSDLIKIMESQKDEE